MSDEQALQKRIDAAIAESLPAQQVDWLRDRLEQADRLETELDRAYSDLGDLRTELDESRRAHGELVQQVADHQTLDARRAELNERERQLELAESTLDLRQQHMQDRLDDHRELVALVFKSPTFRTVQTSQTPVDGGEYATGYTDNAGQQYMARTGETLMDTTTTTQTSET